MLIAGQGFGGDDGDVAARRVLGGVRALRHLGAEGDSAVRGDPAFDPQALAETHVLYFEIGRDQLQLIGQGMRGDALEAQAAALDDLAEAERDVIRIPLPPLTEERRRDLGRVVHQEGENAKIAIRNIRRDANHHLKELLKEKEISEDEERKAEHDIQAVTDVAVKKVDEIVAEKEKELLEI